MGKQNGNGNGTGTATGTATVSDRATVAREIVGLPYVPKGDFDGFNAFDRMVIASKKYGWLGVKGISGLANQAILALELKRAGIGFAWDTDATTGLKVFYLRAQGKWGEPVRTMSAAFTLCDTATQDRIKAAFRAALERTNRAKAALEVGQDMCDAEPTAQADRDDRTRAALVGNADKPLYMMTAEEVAEQFGKRGKPEDK